ncbi:MAG: tetratricopeptide repeat protein [Synergistaceae bacterium]|jgi:tetratricopeptide (TPR) repeat protein|nr:tetratricopeptide repeat protein [Synergistaceae bacterium]
MHDGIHDNDSEKLPIGFSIERSAEKEAVLFVQRLRNMQNAKPMRRASPTYRRSGFRGNGLRFLIFCSLLILVAWASFEGYRHWKRNSYVFLMEEALAFYGQEQYEAAFELYERAAERYSGRVEPLLGMARVAERLGRVEDAVTAYRSSLEFFPKSAVPDRSGVIYEIGRLYSGVKAWDKARASFEEAVLIDPTHYGAYFALANVLEEQDELQAAEDAYRRALDLSPSSPAAREALKRIAIVRAAREEEEKTRAAAQKFEQAMREGSVALASKKYEDASRYFSEALSIRSDDANAWVGFADARNELGDRGGALKSLQRALEHQPEHDEAKTKLAELEAQNKKKQRPRRNTPRNPPKSPKSQKSQKNTSFRIKFAVNNLPSIN